MRVTLTAADGSNVEIRVPGPYNPDILDDMAARAAALINPLPHSSTPCHVQQPPPPSVAADLRTDTATTKAARRGLPSS